MQGRCQRRTSLCPRPNSWMRKPLRGCNNSERDRRNVGGCRKRRAGGAKLFAVRLLLVLKARDCWTPGRLFETLDGLLLPRERPEFIELSDEPVPYTDTLRRRREQPLLDESALQSSGRLVFERTSSQPQGSS